MYEITRFLVGVARQLGIPRYWLKADTSRVVLKNTTPT